MVCAGWSYVRRERGWEMSKKFRVVAVLTFASSFFAGLDVRTGGSAWSQNIGAMADAERCIQEAASNPDLAIRYCDRALKGQDSLSLDILVDTFRARGYAFFHKGDQVRAISDFSAAIASNANDKLAYFARGFARQNNGDLTGAISDYSEAIRIDPAFAPAFDKRCTAYVQKNDYKRAMEDCDEGARLKKLSGTR